MSKLPQSVIDARIKGEQARTIGNIAARSERPSEAFWLSFAGDDGFHGAVIVHAEDFLTAIMECNLRGINPHGECRGMPIPAEAASLIAESWKYRILTREDCEQFDLEMGRADKEGTGK